MNVSPKKGPLYIQIKMILKERILHGVYPIGENIPAEPQLELEFDVSKITVRNAVKELVQEGYLEKKSGKGTKVIRNTSLSKLSRGKRFTELLVEEGNRIEKKLLRVELITNEENTELYRLFGKQVYKVERMYYLNDQPYIYYYHFLTPAIQHMQESDIDKQSLYGFLEQKGIYLESFRDEFAVGIPSEGVADALKIESHTALLKRLRYSYNELGQVIEYSEGYYHTEKQRYVVNYDV
ncbi:GntR family transcriptional regulator [Halalkalibacter hemicellulosilyticus]|uniref:Transcriptional regulator n=1 Tax=Halalkalibacter hemicellulosilyticusJCM 9152 TaxID=1236971 RepID=W4QLS5_9BACI|nr:GntR family transcriptional regulator [Halalkalibacter hemicellulosilyticus]GAE32852.1 transcriptional regulator [Halalkalibacter hemicellulosilyticusJCM 9152]